ncbi:hypothetical protein P7C71_g5912, partial [Lecanoromycetidae sp. Uapishka_2]
MADTAQIPVRPREDVDPEGDLVLLVGPDEVGIRVNSKVLSRASPVFAAMLGPRFAEGRALQYLAPAEFSSIPLPEDDVDAMIRLCRAFHFKLSINEELVTFDFCLKLASLCDKYDASIALGSWSEVWMKPFRDSFNGDTSYFGGLYIARSFNNHRVFWLITRNIMCNLSAESVKLPDSFPKDMLPDRLVDAINAARGSVLRQLQDTIEGIIAPYLEMPCPLSIYHRQKQEKCGILTLGGHYFQELARLGFWPSSKLLYQSSPAHIAEELPKKDYVFVVSMRVR